MKSLYIYIIILQLSGCFQQTPFTEVDDSFIIKPKEVTVYSNHIPIQNKNGALYHYTKKVNSLGLYAMYGSTISEPVSKASIKWRFTANKFHEEAAANKLYKSHWPITQLHKDKMVTLDLESFGALKGFCINTTSYFQIILQMNNMLLGLYIDGEHKVKSEELPSVFKMHFSELGKINITKH